MSLSSADFGSSWSCEHLLRMGQKRQDDLACDEEPWCLSGSDSSDGRSELVGDFSPITATIDQRFLVVWTCWLLVKGTKVTGVLYMWCLPCLIYVDSACKSFGTNVVCMVGLGCLMSKIQSNDGLRGTTMNVATPSLNTSRTRRERDIERELASEKQTPTSATRKDILQAEHENAASSQHRRDLQAGRACMPLLKGALDPPAQHAPKRSLAEVPVTVTVPL